MSCCMYVVYHVCACAHRSTGVTDSCESSCGCWEVNLDPPKGQSETITAEPSLKSPVYFKLFSIMRPETCEGYSASVPIETL